MVCFVPSICLSIRKSCQRCDCSELGTVRNWVDHCTSQSMQRRSALLKQTLDLHNGVGFATVYEGQQPTSFGVLFTSFYV